MIKASLGLRTAILRAGQTVVHGDKISQIGRYSLCYDLGHDFSGVFLTKTDLRRLGYKEVPKTVDVIIEYTTQRK